MLRAAAESGEDLLALLGVESPDGAMSPLGRQDESPHQRQPGHGEPHSLHVGRSSVIGILLAVCGSERVPRPRPPFYVSGTERQLNALRHNSAGPWLIELAARPIGGRCGEVLRFGPENKSLETILLAQALRRLHTIPEREPQASGVMMIPVNRAGTFQTMDGLETALATPGVTDIAVTVHRGARVQPLPEESRYLGFIFARGPDPASVESTIRTAFAALDIVIE